ncbi:hypothetical protein KIN20_030417 [Parelaphostrongylus tenuis]|uniref:Uncharacterized protein n=1 Tax=Parelaphostrongylus tenuis TaxID=148309 RepID=A0AAD5WGV2_PARTN|nr:hypothetical protein KIN20_030417 [Parelaphostrongylus tenuis]
MKLGSAAMFKKKHRYVRRVRYSERTEKVLKSSFAQLAKASCPCTQADDEGKKRSDNNATNYGHCTEEFTLRLLAFSSPISRSYTRLD